jgi:purine nucleosidase
VTSPTTRSLVIDTDTGSDDAVALLIAARTPGVAIRLVTTVAGNVPLPLATRNAIVTLDVAGAGHVELAEGCSGPMLRPLETAQMVHGEDGMGGAPLPTPSRAPSREHAVDALRRVARDEPGQHVLVTLGPFTNIAAALLIEPDLLTRFSEVWCMAGAFDLKGNVNELGEYNVWADPEAAAIVAAAPGNQTWVGWDVSWRYAVIRPDEQDAMRSMGRIGTWVTEINRQVDVYAREVSGLDGYDLPDPITMAAAIDPSLVRRSERLPVFIGRDELTRGATFINRRHEAPAPNLTVAWEVDEAGFKAMLHAACRD